MTCFVKDCKNIKRLLPLDSEITFHRFPKDENLFRQWLDAIGQSDENISWSKYKYVCSIHFNSEDITKITTFGMTRCLIKSNAIPTRNLNVAAMKKTLTFPQDPTTSKLISTPSSPLRSQVFITPSDSPQRSPLKRKRKMSSSTDTASEVGSEKSVIKSPTLSSSSSSLNRRRKRIKLDHRYTRSPETMKKKFQQITEKYMQQRKKFYKARESVKGLKKRVNSLKDIIKHLKSKDSLSTNATEHLENLFSDIPGALMSRMLKSVRSGVLPRTKYPEELRKFAITLHFYSSKAYDYVRKTFHLALPHPSVLRKWSSTIECEPGFSSVCFEALKVKVEEAKVLTKQVICALLLDEMAIKKQIDVDGRRTWGYIDIGVDVQNGEDIPVSEALVLMVVSQNSSWKLPIAYFLIKSLSGAEKANIVREAIIRLSEIEVEITSVTCDGPTAHFSMFRELGCNFENIENMKTYFSHPLNAHRKVYAIFDICHMLKLLRNCFAQLEIIVDGKGKEIKWYFIKKLHEVQEMETLSLANKLRAIHLQWQRQKMKVNLAAQTLSSSVAEALTFLRVDLKHPDFQGCEATVRFIKMIDKLFDLMNSRIPWAKGFKGPLKISNEDMWRPFMIESISYILQLKDVGGRFLWATSKKTPFVGFAISVYSALGIFDDFVKTNKLSYFLTYKISQDHLELFFCAVRSRNGWNNNPSALQFMRTFRKLILHADISGTGGNCRVLDTTTILTVTSGTKKDPIINLIDISSVRRNNVDIDQLNEEHNYDTISKFISLSEYCENVVTYIGGYVVKMMMRTIHCEDCLELIMGRDEDQRYTFMRRRDLGGLLYPSTGIINICYKTETFIRQLMYITENSLPTHDLIVDIIFQVSRSLLNKLPTIFPDHEEHAFTLMKSTIYCYCKIRIYNLAKKYTANVQGDLIRKKFNKLILFNHQ